MQIEASLSYRCSLSEWQTSETTRSLFLGVPAGNSTLAHGVEREGGGSPVEGHRGITAKSQVHRPLDSTDTLLRLTEDDPSRRETRVLPTPQDTFKGLKEWKDRKQISRFV